MPDLAEHKEFYAKADLWLIRTRYLSHSQFRILCFLMARIGGLKRPWHLTYAEIADGAATNEQTVSEVLQYFQEQNWLTVGGNRQWRKYKLHKDAVEADLWTADDDDDEEEQ